MYHRGQRIALIATADPHTELRPGDKGTVRRYDTRLQQLAVDWDNGSRLSMLLDDGDEVSVLT
ncbi:DUF4314 domain-containing protein [Streptomyces sp. NBC_01321]|uniref:DUF4314 domain-containing protein n=1 Tax=Streptomyces sp. NBC_01321 TaxID=2903825 RepID=UPI002E155A9B|nr:DUF4314 domain-containing protein [Streptomyces sp. NBC_01321]